MSAVALSDADELEDEEAQVDRAYCRSLKAFLREAWPFIAKGRPYVDGWHIGALCEFLEAVSSRQIRRLIINVPPGTMKSLSTCVFWPAWEWSLRPSTRWIFATYLGTLSKRDALRTRLLLESPWYRKRWGRVWSRNPKEWGVARYSNDAAGFRLSTSVEGGAVGEHADIQVVDDPVKPLEATKKGHGKDLAAALAQCIEWWDQTMSTRLVDLTSARVIMMQRIHDSDLSGHAIESGGYVHLMLPMHFDPRRKCVVRLPRYIDAPANDDVVEHVEDVPLEPEVVAPTPDDPIFFEDPRVEVGELLFPQRFPEVLCNLLAKDLGSAASAQLEQDPVQAGGSIFRLDYIQHWRVLPKSKHAFWCQSWDCTFKELSTSDWVVGQVWMQLDGQYYLVDQVREQWTVAETIKGCLLLSAQWPKARKKYIEDKANGPAVVQMLKRHMPGLELVNPEGGKEARANAVQPLWESHNVWIPPRDVEWVPHFIREHIRFPKLKWDDTVDAQTQALNKLHGKTVAGYKTAMAKIRQELGI